MGCGGKKSSSTKGKRGKKSKIILVIKIKQYGMGERNR